jgi:hypothetical protein
MGRAERAYLLGVDSGKSLVNRAWASVNDCDRIETFADIVTANVDAYTLTGSSRYVICRYTGLVDGVFEQLDAVWAGCDSQCCLEGEVIGELSANLYCELSILLGGLVAPDDFVRGPVYTCGFEFQQCCDGAFVGTTARYVGEDFAGRPTQCSTYTSGEYYEVWNGTRALECAYEPDDEEDPALMTEEP